MLQIRLRHPQMGIMLTMALMGCFVHAARLDALLSVS